MKKKILILLIVLAVLSLVACNTESGTNTEIVDENENLIEVNVKDKELLNRSEKISDWVVELYGVDDATTIVFNNDAYIGVVLAFDQEYTEELENTIIYQVKEKDASIENVKVTNNSKTFGEISDVVFNLLQGKSYDSQVKDINKIANKF
ncbi:MAG: YhcN/YlaJ family sporulation lipoprotein [Tissierellaceae bacterium]|nr:YhcN/YlaJ family sporulation lipoprotein [Tissierellaceae bacterium]